MDNNEFELAKTMASIAFSQFSCESRISYVQRKTELEITLEEDAIMRKTGKTRWQVKEMLRQPIPGETVIEVELMTFLFPDGKQFQMQYVPELDELVIVE